MYECRETDKGEKKEERETKDVSKRKKFQAEKLLKHLKKKQFPPTSLKEIRKENDEGQERLTVINEKPKCKQKKNGNQEQPWCSSPLIYLGIQGSLKTALPYFVQFTKARLKNATMND